MTVLYISYDGMTDALGRSQVIPYLEGLSQKGYKIHILSCEKQHVSAAERQEVETLLRQSGISWTPLKFSTRPPWVSKLADVIRIQRKAVALYKKHSFDLVHCRSYIASLAGLHLKKKFGLKFVFDMRGFWANERIEGDMWNLANPFYNFIYKYFKRREKEFFDHADAVVSLTHNGKEVIADLFGTEVANRTTVIPCCVDTRLFSPENINPDRQEELRKKLGMGSDTFVLSYLGSIGTWYMTREMMLFFKKMQEKYANARFLYISGDDPQFIKAEAAKAGVNPDHIMVNKASRNEVPLWLSLSDLSVFFIRPVFSKKASSPTKQAEIMSMGIPAICNSGIGDTDAIFTKERTGIVLSGFSDEAFDMALDQLDELMSRQPEEIRKSALNYFSLDDGVEKYAAIYKMLHT